MSTGFSPRSPGQSGTLSGCPPTDEGLANGLGQKSVGRVVLLQALQHLAAADREGSSSIADGLVKALPALQALRHGVTEQIGRDPVIVAPVGGTAAPLQHPMLLQQPGIGAYAGLADPQRGGQLVQGTAILAHQQQSEYPAGDAW